MTRLFAYLGEAIASLWRNRVRSGLTMLGMIIGSASIIAVFGISKAATSGIASTFNSFGQSPLVVFVDGSQLYPNLAQMQYRDIAAVTAALGSSAAAVEPGWNRTYPVSSAIKKDFVSINADGSYHTDHLVLAAGREFSQSDVDSAARVCVLTNDLAREYFGSAAQAMGSFLRINGVRFQVVGVYADIKGSFLNSLGGSSNIIVPYTTFHDDLYNGELDYLVIYPADPLQADAVGKNAVLALQHIHGSRAKYTSQNTADELNTFENVLNIVGTGLSAIGGVALLVAGIGIMNIMLVSVTERTREIGIRKSIGASRNDIALQFLIESILLSISGGLIGMGIGLVSTIGAASILSKTLGELLIPYLLIISIAIMFSLVIGTVFGTYPALRAASMDPIEALRS